MVLLCSVVLLAAAVKPNNKLENTKWTGILNVPLPANVMLEFKKDMFIILVDENIIETMSYKVTGDTLEIKKLEGGSPCGDEKGVYKFTVANDVFKVETIDDACGDRVAAWTSEGYKKR